MCVCVLHHYHPLQRIIDSLIIGFVTGQVIFSSGWEWGYWLSDVVAAEAAWDPRVGHPQGENGPPPRVALASIVADVLATSVGEEASVVGAWVSDIAHAQVGA